MAAGAWQRAAAVVEAVINKSNPNKSLSQCDGLFNFTADLAGRQLLGTNLIFQIQPLQLPPLTPEQQAIVASSKAIKINAVAGSGKTTTLMAYAQSRKPGNRILYLAFNKSVRLEAARKFSALQLQQVSAETAHSLAYKYVVHNSRYVVRAAGYKTHELAALLGLQGPGDKHARFVLANHINKLAALFCNSTAAKVSELQYLDYLSDDASREFVTQHYELLLAQTRLFLAKMHRAEIEITHDFYLKQFQLMQPQLPFDYILFDEGQDASPAMLDVFLKQQAVKVIVGDTHQQIYGWRHAVNSLDKVDFESFSLSSSFRFGSDIARLAQNVLRWKAHLDLPSHLQLQGKGKGGKIQSKAIIARTNLGLLLKAISYINDKNKPEKIHFEGKISSYTYADEGASLYDVLNLSRGNTAYIRDPLLQQMKDLSELEDYIEQTEDAQLAMMVEIVQAYGSEIPDLLQKLKSRHVDNPAEADVIFSTVHRCKGMEYDQVQLVDDFMSEEKLEKLIEDESFNELQRARLAEEINLLYVAVTRAKSLLFIPQALLPTNISPSNAIKVLLPAAQLEANARAGKDISRAFAQAKKQVQTQTAFAAKSPKTAQAAGAAWSKAHDQELRTLYKKGIPLKILANHFGRTPSAIYSRVKKLGLVEG